VELGSGMLSLIDVPSLRRLVRLIRFSTYLGSYVLSPSYSESQGAVATHQVTAAQPKASLPEEAGLVIGRHIDRILLSCTERATY